jgi:putative ribosome biogenesis GTPase RsgA
MEPDCRVREAVEGGAVAPDRYQSYLTLLQELEAQPRDWE